MLKNTEAGRGRGGTLTRLSLSHKYLASTAQDMDDDHDGPAAKARPRGRPRTREQMELVRKAGAEKRARTQAMAARTQQHPLYLIPPEDLNRLQVMPVYGTSHVLVNHTAKILPTLPLENIELDDVSMHLFKHEKLHMRLTDFAVSHNHGIGTVVERKRLLSSLAWQVARYMRKAAFAAARKVAHDGNTILEDIANECGSDESPFQIRVIYSPPIPSSLQLPQHRELLLALKEMTPTSTGMQDAKLFQTNERWGLLLSKTRDDGTVEFKILYCSKAPQRSKPSRTTRPTQ